MIYRIFFIHNLKTFSMNNETKIKSKLLSQNNYVNITHTTAMLRFFFSSHTARRNYNLNLFKQNICPFPTLCVRVQSQYCDLNINIMFKIMLTLHFYTHTNTKLTFFSIYLYTILAIHNGNNR